MGIQSPQANDEIEFQNGMVNRSDDQSLILLDQRMCL